ncbi:MULTISPECIES: sensor histidine kinase [Paenibacillus]|uniref:histidine kinase n=1 Tax=Paenibacillus macerans TaxID=44252 RepID=A0A090ZDM4_PAEMA|nr:HAMP domain-containing sensor histidine kinase [Paenibacillus macerans]KFN08732.1 HAMP domain protein [Paenibacillus macerans]MBS5912211.1 HAMP domain-containing histidine kinase [Paenibacillus macerans]MCY7562121.1 HAMP domain-containing histidine kinase [Paenibacillus macerans]MEC0155130.1 HAMP domain-containing sensor histidine kinase [Paenibacillus macerans]MEC0330179.1 HAMP domain-containing sensor histidine kinase [Paenibacillus macerans]
MIKKGIGRQIVLHYFIVVFVTLFMVEIIFTVAIRSYYYDTIYNHMANHSKWASDFFQQFVRLNSERDPDYFTEMLRTFELDNTELMILDRNGEVKASTNAFQADKAIQTGDVPQALAGSVGKWIGRQPSTGEAVMAVSRPLQIQGQTQYIARFVTSLERVNSKLLNLTFLSIGVAAAVLALVTLFSIGLANSIVKPINNIRDVSAQMARGKFDARIRGNYKYELGELAATLNYMAEEIVRSNQIKDEFISSISHELRTPLTGIKGWSETLTSGGFDPEETKLGMGIIAKETNRLIGLVEEILDFSKLQQNEMKLVIGHVNLKELIQETMLNVWAKAEQKQIQLKLEERTDRTVIVSGDGNRLKQVFLNIVDNAIKFSHEQSWIHLVISVKEDGRAMVEVVDTGIGISEEYLHKVKDRFFQVNHQGGGTGLGLAISQQIVELHHGVMEIHSELGVGTTVAVTLPVAEDAEASDVTASAAPEDESSADGEAGRSLAAENDDQA